MIPEPVAVTLRVTSALESLRVPYAISGSLASALYGVARATQDVDIIADLHPAHVRPLVDRLIGEFYIDDDATAQEVAHRGSFNLIHRETMIQGGYLCFTRPSAGQSSACQSQTAGAPHRARGIRSGYQPRGRCCRQTALVPARTGGFRQAVAGCDRYAACAGRHTGQDLSRAVRSATGRARLAGASNSRSKPHPVSNGSSIPTLSNAFALSWHAAHCPQGGYCPR